MPLVPDNRQVNFLGLDTKADPRQLEPGKLTQADNVEMQTSGMLNRRRGYLRLNTVTDVAGVDLGQHQLFHRLAVFGQRLVILAHDRIIAVADRASALSAPGTTTSSIINHGPIPRASIAAFHVCTGDVLGDVDAG
jgi:hypothetical protein